MKAESKCKDGCVALQSKLRNCSCKQEAGAQILLWSFPFCGVCPFASATISVFAAEVQSFILSYFILNANEGELEEFGKPLFYLFLNIKFDQDRW